ncbi:hybrid sensor histidine kinase/response regulator [Salinimicrobium gaetbulicola]|uniref:histidine kinase n=1 Tax=Salinimicrobium gaetbulicola TaxID=999702 RepID=A0ABW3IIS6_9FLAO
MTKKRPSITITVFAGYILLAALAGFAVWFVYNQVITFTNMTDRNNSGNEKLLLVGEAAAQLYEAESLSRQLIQNGDLEGLENYTAKIDSIKATLLSLQRADSDESLEEEVDSINILLSQKANNLEELLELRAGGETESYYLRVLNELQKVDQTFEVPNYEERFKELEPHQRNVLIKLLEYSQQENPDTTSLSADSLITAVKSVLSDLEKQERQYRIALKSTENDLFANEIKLNNRLRSLLSTIEAEERQKTLKQVTNWQSTVENTSKTIALIGAVSLLVILIFVFLVIRDVSRSQEYRVQLENAKGYAESLLKSREQIMNTVTHDMRSPLNSVAGYTGLLEKTDLNKSQNRYLNQVKKSSNYLLHLVNDLLDLSKLEAGKMSIEELSFNAKNLIEETVENAIPPEKPSTVEVLVNVSDQLDRTVITDPFRIKQILTNLVSNACKFTQKGKVEINATLEKNILNIEVLDTGIGISKEQREKVFEEFSQEDTSIEKKYGGSGLGLAISKKLTELLNGEITLESEPGKGSTFLVRIPVKVSEKPSVEKAPIKEVLAELKEKSVLIVDDEPSQLGLLTELIKSQGMSYRTASNGKEALRKLNEKKVDLVLTDIQMPEMDGLELMNEIKSNKELHHIPVIALSGQSHVHPKEYLQHGFKGSLLKPYSSERLLELIGEILQVEFKKEEQKLSPVDPTKPYTLREIKTFSGGDQQALNTILESFIQSTKANSEALEVACENEDFEKVSAVAHKMLPMFRQLQAGELILKLEILESADPEKLKKVKINSLSEKIDQLLNTLRQEIKV